MIAGAYDDLVVGDGAVQRRQQRWLGEDVVQLLLRPSKQRHSGSELVTGGCVEGRRCPPGPRPQSAKFASATSAAHRRRSTSELLHPASSSDPGLGLDAAVAEAEV